jgi:hypothetical protein
VPGLGVVGGGLGLGWVGGGDSEEVRSYFVSIFNCKEIIGKMGLEFSG